MSCICRRKCFPVGIHGTRRELAQDGLKSHVHLILKRWGWPEGGEGMLDTTRMSLSWREIKNKISLPTTTRSEGTGKRKEEGKRRRQTRQDKKYNLKKEESKEIKSQDTPERKRWATGKTRRRQEEVKEARILLLAFLSVSLSRFLCHSCLLPEGLTRRIIR